MSDGRAKLGLGALGLAILGILVSIGCTTDPLPGRTSDTDASSSSETTASPSSSTSRGMDTSTGTVSNTGVDTSTSISPDTGSSTATVDSSSSDTGDESSSSTSAEVCVSVGVTGGQLLTAPADPELILAASTATTLEGWFYADAGAQGQIIGSRGASLPGWSVRYGGATLSLELQAPGSEGVSVHSPPLAEEEWHHFAFVRSATFPNGWMLYVDGQEAAASVNASMQALGFDIGCDYDFLLGAYPPFDNQQFSGLLGAMALSNTDRYIAAFVPSVDLVNDGDTIALWAFDAGIGSVVEDVVGDDDLTMVDATWEQTGPGCP